MKTLFIIVEFSLLFTLSVNAQTTDRDTRIDTINKKIKDFDNEYDQSTPLKAGIMLSYAMAKGENSKLVNMSSPRIRDRMAMIKNKDKNYLDSLVLNSTILEVINYKDSIAGIICKQWDILTLRFLTRQNSKWLNEGQDLAGSDLQSAKTKFKQALPFYQNALRKIAILDKISTDTLAFANYLKQHAISPKDYLLNKLTNHKLVVYGEIHGRKNSADLLKDLIYSSQFSDNVGTVFMEVSLNTQEAFDRFLNNKAKDPEIILDIFRKEDLMGGNDRCWYEIILALWNVNSKLSKNKKIRIVPVDTPRPFQNSNVTKEDYDEYERNTIDYRDYDMANNIEQYIKTKQDKRNCLFIVGYMHAYRSQPDAMGSRKVPDKRNCISILSDKLAANSLFSIITHGPVMTNYGPESGLTRKGLFDYVFAEEGDKPVAFDLKESPFGKEPFKVADNRYNIKMGTYQDCYDGYIFLQPLKEEARYWLPELMTKAFFEEVKRRAVVVEEENYIMYDGVAIKDADYGGYLQEQKKRLKDTRRWHRHYPKDGYTKSVSQGEPDL